MRRVHPTTGEVFVPHRFGDGKFQLADPRLGRIQHHAQNAIRVSTETEAADYVRRGYSLRMRGMDTSKVNLITASNIVF
jgi:archaeosine-15-forming tRNA-guanine transglycosylase